MNCKRFHGEIGRLLRQEHADDPLRQDLERHALACPGCAAHLDRERILGQAFQEVRRSLEKEEAREEVGERLRQSFLRNTSRPRIQGKGRRWVLPIRFRIAAAVTILVAAIAAAVVYRDTVFRRGGDPDLNKMAGRSNRSDNGMNNGHEINPEELGSLGVDSLPAIDTDFIDLGGCRDRDCWEGSQLLRVKLPRSSLLYFGLPMNNTLADDRISADVLVGRDGMARAIRFVQITERRSNR